jgi:hypothetical protein
MPSVFQDKLFPYWFAAVVVATIILDIALIWALF